MYKRSLICLASLSLSIIAQAEPQCEFKLGMILPMSGEQAWVGEEIRDGASLALKETAVSVPKIDLVIEDTAYSQSRSAAAAAKLINSDRIGGILSLWDTADVVAPITEAEGVISLGIRWNHNITKNRPLTFTFESSYESYMDSTLQLLQSLGKKKIAIIYQQLAGWEIGIEYLKQAAPSKGLELIAIEGLTLNEVDFGTVIVKIAAKKPDVILNFGNPPFPDLIIRQLKRHAPKVFHTGYYSLIADRTLIEGIPFVDQLGFYPEFEEKFTSAYGRPPKSRGGHAYEIIHLLQHSISAICARSEAITPAAVASELANIKNFPSVLGPLTAGPERNIEHPNYWKFTKAGQFVSYP